MPEATQLENSRAGSVCVTRELASLLTVLCVARLPPLGQLSFSCLTAVSGPLVSPDLPGESTGLFIPWSV